MHPSELFWTEDPLPVVYPRLHGLYAPHPLRCARYGCCTPIAWMTTDRRLPYLGTCDAHKVHTVTVPVVVYEQFSNFPEDVRAYAARMFALELARAKQKAEAA